MSNFHNKNWSPTNIPPIMGGKALGITNNNGRVGGCITYWVLVAAVLSLVKTVFDKDPLVDQNKLMHVGTKIGALVATHLFFSYTCHRNRSSGGMAVLVAFGWLVVWFMVWEKFVPMMLKSVSGVQREVLE